MGASTLCQQKQAFSKPDIIAEKTGKYRHLQFTESRLAQVEHAQQNPAALSSDPEELELSPLIEANRIRLAYQFDPMLAVSVS